jgi:hypothetical protein
MKIKSILLTTVVAFGLTGAASAATYTYNFTTSGSDVATASPVSPPAGSPTVTVTAWSTTNGSSWTQGLVTQNGNAGMGARTHSNDSHTIDNGTRFDFLLFYFGGASVDVNSFSIGYIDGDSDYRWGVAGTTLSTLFTGGTNVANGNFGSNPINGSNTLGTYLLIGATPSFDDNDDRFKISSININYSNGVPDAGSPIALLGVGLITLFGLQRRFRA